MFDPPNSLKMKAKDKLSADVIAKKLDAELQVARERLAGEKLRRDSFQVCVLWRLLQDQPDDSPQFAADLLKLSNLTRAIERRCADTDQGKAAEHCAAMLVAADDLRHAGKAAPALSGLGAAALSLHQQICPEKSSADQMREIDATVAIIRARNQATALAS